VIYGDADGNGKVDSEDSVLIKKHITMIQPLTGAYLEAADADRNGTVDSGDTIAIQKHIVMIELINQGY